MNSLSQQHSSSPERQVNKISSVNKSNKSKVSDILVISEINDYFISNPPKQPKREIAEYVESFWISVPVRYSSIWEAIASGEEFVIRSEHPYEYSWIWGLFSSFVVNTEARASMEEYFSRKWYKFSEEDLEAASPINELSLFRKAIKHRELWLIDDTWFEKIIKNSWKKPTTKFCELTGMNHDDFLENLTFSYWKYIRWYNRSIIADSSIKWRYHIITNWWENRYYRNYTIFDNGKILENEVSELEPLLKNNLDADIMLYEKIRALPDFDLKNAPIMELQTDFTWKSHFLQTHRWRDFWFSNFILDRPKEDWELEAEFVRWSTSPEWIEANVTMTYNYWWFELDQNEEWSCDPHYNTIYAWLMYKFRKVQFVQWSFNRVRYWVTCHTKLEELFSPGISIVLDFENLLWDIPRIELTKLSRELKRPVKVRFRILSDWRKCFIKLLDTYEEIIDRCRNSK